MADKPTPPGTQLIEAVGELTVYLTTSHQAKLKERTPTAHWRKVNELERNVETAVKRFAIEQLKMMTWEQATEMLARQAAPVMIYPSREDQTDALADLVKNTAVKPEWQAPDCQDDD